MLKNPFFPYLLVRKCIKIKVNPRKYSWKFLCLNKAELNWGLKFCTENVIFFLPYERRRNLSPRSGNTEINSFLYTETSAAPPPLQRWGGLHSEINRIQPHNAATFHDISSLNQFLSSHASESRIEGFFRQIEWDPSTGLTAPRTIVDCVYSGLRA